MRKLLLFVSIVVASVAIAKDIEFEPFLADARAGAEARQAAGAMTLDPGEEYVVIAVEVRRPNGELVRTFDLASPGGSLPYGAAFGAQPGRLTCELSAY